ncbi:hypothetical protein HYH03_016480 [Edaphochlamys debaryana]|uniref:Uncharacterized protein n=1 Tax=Edaphochlamys debaryana TaxID=47281 RepID=A0A835XL17_9CHLO|nr:hypothetical protein HYH03_016480 [Edaphochlamys debaryana]|eukprot:KAG2484733.1 hypothetical protein HYH03_016480 [Edaphochlamys debaryana]
MRTSLVSSVAAPLADEGNMCACPSVCSRAINATFVTASCSLLIRNNANVTAVVDQAHFYASYTPMPNFNPGQFPAATITGIPGAEGTNTTMTARVGGTKAANSSPIYLACHWGVAAC